MEFLVKRFLSHLKDYRFINFTCTKLKDGSYNIIIHDVPPKLDAWIMRKEYPYIGLFGNKETTRLAQPIEVGLRRHLEIILDERTYAFKINALDVYMRRYGELLHLYKNR